MKALIFDTETTGLIDNHTIAIDKQPEIIEFWGGLIDLKTGKIWKKLSTLIKPSQYPRTEKIIKDTKTAISDTELADAKPFSYIHKNVQNLIESAPAVIAHNLSFDMEMVDLEFERLGQKINWPKKKICTVEQTAHLQGKRLTLTNLYELLFKEKFADAHRAAADSKALIRVCVELYKRGLI